METGRIGRFFVCGALLIAAACSGDNGNSGSPTAQSRQTGNNLANLENTACSEVRYLVEGTAKKVNITMSNSDGGTSQQNDISVPMENKAGDEGLQLGCLPDDAFLYISAQNQGPRGSVTCRIERDGRTVAESTSRGAYVIATCDD